MLSLNTLINIRQLVLITTLLLTGCSESTDKEMALNTSKLSERNGQQLNKAIIHYSKYPGDSLKLRALKFLIRRMKTSYTIYSPSLNAYTNFLNTINIEDSKRNVTADQSVNLEIRNSNLRKQLQSYEDTLTPVDLNTEIQHDYDFVSAELLIDNIDYAFKAWSLPWAKHYDFDEFCNYILPYRFGREELSIWRSYFFNHLQWVIDSAGDTSDPIAVCKYLNSWIFNDLIGYFPMLNGLKGSTSLKNLFIGKIYGNCYDQAGFIVSVLRSVGIPATMAYIPSWGCRSAGHVFPVVMDSSHQWLDYQGNNRLPGHKKFTTRAPKVFIEAANSSPPPEFANEIFQRLPFLEGMTDFTSSLFPTVDISIQDDKQIEKTKPAFICVFNNFDWVPIDYAKIDKGKVIFRNMGTGMAYLPVFFENNKMIPISNPILVDSSGSISELSHGQKNISFTFTRKYPLFSFNTFPSGDNIGGVFQVSNDEHFKEATTIYKIIDTPSRSTATIKVPTVTGRYVRYIFPVVDRPIKDGPAHIGFWNEENKKLIPLNGKHVSSKLLSMNNVENVFDNDLLTSVRVCKPIPGQPTAIDGILCNVYPKDRIWIGMDLGSEKEISYITFCPKNDKNQIYKGMLYELFYWNDKWTSLGKKQSEDNFITFQNIPEDNLLLLRNLSEGKEERICTIKNNNLLWW